MADAFKAAAGVKTLVCLSHLRWNFVFQRPQHLMTRAAKSYRVFFLEEPLFEDCAKAHLALREDDKSNVMIATPIFPHGASRQDQLDGQREFLDLLLLGIEPEDTILWYYTPMSLAFSDHIRAGRCVYDNMDELSAFKNAAPELVAFEEQMMQRADLVFTGGYSLFRAKRHRHDNIHPVPSSIDTAHFGRARKVMKQPDDQREIAGPRLGFFGVLDERFDIALLAGLAALRPDWQFIMIGPVVKIDPATLPRAPNIHWLGMKSYEQLPDYLAGWDVGIMPFAINEATRFISPTKTPEFLAAGLPVVSTPIRDVIVPYGEKGLVEIAATAQDFAVACGRMLAMPDRDAFRARVDNHLAKNSWDLTWARMDALIAPATGRKAAGAGTVVAAHA